MSEFSSSSPDDEDVDDGVTDKAWIALDYGETPGDAHDRDVPSDVMVRNSARTGFDPNDIPTEVVERRGEYVDYYEWLNRMNDGVGEAGRATDNHHANTERDLEAFASTLDLTDRQVERARWLLDAIGIQDLHRQASVEEGVLAFLTIAANEDTRWIRNEDVYEDLLDDLDVESDRIRELRRRITQHDEYQSPTHS